VSDPRREFLLDLYTHLAPLPPAEQPAAASQRAAGFGISARWQGTLNEPPHESAVRIAHSLGMGPAGAQLWRASWNGDAQGAAPLTSLAMVVARLLSGREELLLLAARCGREAAAASGIPEVQEGVLVDGNSCARMAVAGFDVETELRAGRALTLLEAAGDLIYGAGIGGSEVSLLVIGLHLRVGALGAHSGALRLGS
jgi:hypothetical protein